MMTAVAPSRKLVVSAASRHGGTCEIADRLAQTLKKDLATGWTVTRPDLADMRVFDDADAVVLGSAIYYGHWMHSASHALTYLGEAAPVDLWLFSTGPVSEVESENEQVISADALVSSGQAIEHKVFGGRLDTSRLSWVERVAVKAVHAVPGDHRDWTEVDAWAHHIAEQLSGAQRSSDGTKDTSDGDAVL
jgi:menaquinone-dependent protoporphyrinogen oxidase